MVEVHLNGRKNSKSQHWWEWLVRYILNGVGKDLQTDVTTPNDMRTDPTLLRYSSAITEQRKCHGTDGRWLKSFTAFKLLGETRTTCTNVEQAVQTDATCSTQHCCDLLADNITRRLTSRIYGTEL